MDNNTKMIIGAVVAVCVITIFFFVFRSHKSEIKPPAKSDTIVAFGDSLTVGVGSGAEDNQGGWEPTVEKKLGRSIIRVARSGATTEDAIGMLDDVRMQKPDVVLVFLGGNDALRRFPVDDTFVNLKKIVDSLKQNGVFVVLIGVKGGLFGDRYSGQFEKLANEENIALVPNALEGVFGVQKFMSDDGIHPNAVGYEVMGAKIGDVLIKYIPSR